MIQKARQWPTGPLLAARVVSEFGSRRHRDRETIFLPLIRPQPRPRAAAPGRLGSVVTGPHNARHGRASAQAREASGEGYHVLSGSRIVGRILLSDASPASQWVWTVSYGYHEGRTPTHGYAESREAAMQAFAKGWHRE